MSFNDDPPYVIAEIGGNHGGDVEEAKRYLRAAAKTGADAAKFQYYQAETLIDREIDALPGAPDEYETQFERFRDLELEPTEWDELVALANELGVDFAASAFDREAAEYVAERGIFVKIASGDVTDLPLLRHVASLDAPAVLSTGFATMAEIERAVETLGTDGLTLLHCMGAYPTPLEEANLQMIGVLAERFDVPVGYSDHTVGLTASRAAVARGATVVEKHFTLTAGGESGDHRLSATPEEMATLIDDVEAIEKTSGSETRDGAAFSVESAIKADVRRSLATAREVRAGDRFEEDDLLALRPEHGISPLRVDEVVGKRAATDCGSHEILQPEDVQDF